MQSFQDLANWCNEVSTQSEPDAIVILVNSQADRKSERKVFKDAGEEFRSDRNIQFFI